MSDEMIKGILLERKRQERRRQQNIELIKEAAGVIVGWGSLLFICFMMTVVFG